MGGWVTFLPPLGLTKPGHRMPPCEESPGIDKSGNGLEWMGVWVGDILTSSGSDQTKSQNAPLWGISWYWSMRVGSRHSYLLWVWPNQVTECPLVRNLLVPVNQANLVQGPGWRLILHICQTSVADPGCFYPGSDFFPSRIPDPNCLHPGSRIRIKEFEYFNPQKNKKMFSKL